MFIKEAKKRINEEKKQSVQRFYGESREFRSFDTFKSDWAKYLWKNSCGLKGRGKVT